MNRLLLLLIAIAIILPGCATRTPPGDCLEANGNVAAQTQRPNQEVSKTDALTGAALADSDGDATLSNQKVGVDVQSPNQATGANFQIAPLLGDSNKGAASILTQTFPGEKAVLDRLASNETNAALIRDRLSTDPTLTFEEKTSLEARLVALDASGDSLIERLDLYAEKKIAAARAVVPDLSSLSSIVYLITSNQTAGNDAPNISDAQAEAIARVAERAVEVSQTETE